MPNTLLARYFEGRGILGNLDFATIKDTQPDDLFAAWLDLPDSQRNPMDADFREIFELSDEKGFCAIRDEAEWQLRAEPEALSELVEKLSALDNHFERAMVTFLDHHEFWDGSTLFHHADCLSYWRKRKNLPHVPVALDMASRDELAHRISNYFHVTEGRGKNCMVDVLRRGELDYFFAYPEDYSQQSIEWVSGEFNRRPHNPAFEVIYLYSQADGSLDLNIRGASKAIEPLQGIFAETILKLSKLPPDPGDKSIYDLSPLLSREFNFVFSVESGIQAVAVKKLRLSSRIKKGDRITLEADASGNSKAVYDLLDQISKALSLPLYNVTQVELAATVSVNPTKPPKKVTIRITYPNSCSLKYDDVDLRLREMLVSSGIEPKDVIAGMEAVESLGITEA
jgi:hypothetical protein